MGPKRVSRMLITNLSPGVALPKRVSGRETNILSAPRCRASSASAVLSGGVPVTQSVRTVCEPPPPEAMAPGGAVLTGRGNDGSVN